MKHADPFPAFLFTYGRMTEESLRGDTIDMAVKSVQEVSDARHQSFITVSYKTSVMWSIPVEKCHTWLVRKLRGWRRCIFDERD